MDHDQPIPFMEVETSWSRVCALQAPDGMDEDEFFQLMDSAEMLDLTVPFSVQTPQWANYVPLSRHLYQASRRAVLWDGSQWLDLQRQHSPGNPYGWRETLLAGRALHRRSSAG